MRSYTSFALQIAFLLLAITYTSAEFNKKAKNKFYEQTIKDLTRKSIVFDKHTPDVFYCIPSKPVGDGKVIVKSRPIHKLCEYEGNIPKIHKSDCYNDVDESDYACKEKYRIMMRQYPPGSDAPYNGTRLEKFMKASDTVTTNDKQKLTDKDNTDKSKSGEKQKTDNKPLDFGDKQKPKSTEATKTKPVKKP